MINCENKLRNNNNNDMPSKAEVVFNERNGLIARIFEFEPSEASVVEY